MAKLTEQQLIWQINFEIRQDVGPVPRHGYIGDPPEGYTRDEYERIWAIATKDYAPSQFMTIEQDAKYRAGLPWWK
jgi:hypothetical protein